MRGICRWLPAYLCLGAAFLGCSRPLSTWQHWRDFPLTYHSVVSRLGVAMLVPRACEYKFAG